ncbi:MAG: hypothetical protein GXY64_00950 [Bacteroidales bacterium]|nr:hypothetical protein [Bacteroidales bacterium]
MTQDELWNKNYDQIFEFMKTNKRRPSKHRTEDLPMLNWFKYQKKKLAQNTLKKNRISRFKELLKLADKYLRVNQHSYTTYVPVGRPRKNGNKTATRKVVVKVNATEDKE